MTNSISHTLRYHPDTPSAAIQSISVTAQFAADGALSLRYLVVGKMTGIKLPAPRIAGPADNLWQQTCCEAFVASANGEPYREFNFSPSAQWAIYQFAAYRQRDEHFQPPDAPQITLQQQADGFELAATIPSELLPPGAALDLALTTVIEASDGSKSYWALAHCAAQPDFHLRQSFILALKRNTP